MLVGALIAIGSLFIGIILGGMVSENFFEHEQTVKELELTEELLEANKYIKDLQVMQDLDVQKVVDENYKTKQGLYSFKKKVRIKEDKQ